MPNVDTEATGAAEIAHFAVDPRHTGLVIVDMQSCFVADSPVAAPLGWLVLAATVASR
jgi:hypothetical protein